MMTDAQAEAARVKLAEYEEAKAAEARQAESERRSTARTNFAPLTALLPELTAAADKLRAVVDGGLGDERGLLDLARNVLITADGLAGRHDRRVEDTEPAPEPAPGPTPPGSPAE